MHKDTPAIRTYWQEYKNATGCAATDYIVIGFDDTLQVRNELMALVLAGTKRGTTSLRRDYNGNSDPMPKVGNHLVILDGQDVPSCILQDIQVDVVPFGQVDEQFAWDEGEDDRSLAYWRMVHIRYFSRRAEREGFIFDDTTEAVLERFRVVWPLEVADPAEPEVVAS